MKSIIQDKKECYICKTTLDLALHHVFYGSTNRKKSDKDGMVIWLCNYHHNMSNYSVHFNKKLDLRIKKEAQEVYEKKHSREEFIKRYGKSYL